MKEENLFNMTTDVTSTQDSVFVAETVPNIEASEVIDSGIKDNEASKILSYAVGQDDNTLVEGASSPQADQPEEIEAEESSD